VWPDTASVEVGMWMTVDRVVLCQIVLKLIDNIWYVLLASAQDQNDNIASKYKIIPTRIVNFS
jgi:hypothetical protein